MVSCDYSPHRQKKEGEISSPVVSDLHPLSISSARLTSARPSATEHVQQLEAMYVHESNKTENIQRDCCAFLIFFLSASPQFYLWQYDAHFDINISLHIYYSECQRRNLIGSLYHLVQMFASADFSMNVVQYWLLLLWYSSGVQNLWDINIFTRVHTLSCSCFLISDALIIVKCAIMTQIVYQKAGYTSYLHHITKRGLELEADESSAAAYLFL